MDITIRLPADTIDPDDPDLVREIEEAVVYSLVGSGRIDLVSAGNALGLDRDAAQQWYEGYRSSPGHDGPGGHDRDDPLPGLDQSLTKAFADAARLQAERAAEREAEGDSLEGGPRFIMLEDLTQDELDNLDRYLDITPAGQGSGYSDISINHDRYMDDELKVPRLIEYSELTPEEFEGLELYLEATPAEHGSGHSDISVNHDRYMDDDEV